MPQSQPASRLLLLGGLLHAALAQAAGPADIRVQAGDLSAAATGAGARAAINLGAPPPGFKPGCGKVVIRVGGIHKQAVGDGAQAVVNLPPAAPDCQEKTP